MTKDASWAGHAAALGDVETGTVSEGARVSDGHLSVMQASLMAGAAEGRARNFQKAKAHFDKCLQVLRANTDDPLQHLTMAKHYAAIDDFSVALELLEPLAARAPGNRDVLRLLGATARRSGKLELAISTFQKLLVQEPNDVELHHSLTRAHLMNRNYPGALAAADAWLKIAPGNAEALSLKSIAVNEVSGREGVADLLNFEKFASVGTLAPPEGYGSVSTFNLSLETAIIAEGTLSDRPTRGGFRVSDELFGAETGPLRELEHLICDHVDAYYERLDKRRKSPFIRTVPDTYVLDGWARVYDGPAAQLPEIHGEAHLCGYYYIQVPGGEEANSGSASLTLGPAPPDLKSKRSLPSLNVWPEPGTIALFPAYMFSLTKPVIAGRRLTCIAFSVMPA